MIKDMMICSNTGNLYLFKKRRVRAAHPEIVHNVLFLYLTTSFRHVCNKISRYMQTSTKKAEKAILHMLPNWLAVLPDNWSFGSTH